MYIYIYIYIYIKYINFVCLYAFISRYKKLNKRYSLKIDFHFFLDFYI